MFAVEGTAANMYLLYLAKKFSDEKSEKNAKSVFFCSLWYLPVLLAAFVFHSRMWAEDKNNNSELLISQIRDKLRGVCAHEVMYNCTKTENGDENEDGSSSKSSSGSLLCPKVLSVAVANTDVTVEQHVVDMSAAPTTLTVTSGLDDGSSDSGTTV
jgi:hypothetical protein